jgi:hypothetical protein
MVDSIRLTKRKFILLIVVVIIIAALLVYFLEFYPKQQKEKGIEQYKKALYESVVCQYSCPLENLTIMNQTQLLPGTKCVAACIQQLKDKGYTKSLYTDGEMTQDFLIKDIEAVVVACRAQGTNNETGVQDNEKIMSCSVSGMNALKQNYAYLQ